MLIFSFFLCRDVAFRSSLQKRFSTSSTLSSTIESFTHPLCEVKSVLKCIHFSPYIHSILQNCAIYAMDKIELKGCNCASSWLIWNEYRLLLQMLLWLARIICSAVSINYASDCWCRQITLSITSRLSLWLRILHNKVSFCIILTASNNCSQR
jgi:hypothetical protein